VTLGVGFGFTEGDAILVGSRPVVLRVLPALCGVTTLRRALAVGALAMTSARSRSFD
jgi:hypothetical protein